MASNRKEPFLYEELPKWRDRSKGERALVLTAIIGGTSPLVLSLINFMFDDVLRGPWW